MCPEPTPGQVLAVYQAGLDAGDASFETEAPSWADFDAARLPGHRHVATADDTGELLGWAARSARCPAAARTPGWWSTRCT